MKLTEDLYTALREHRALGSFGLVELIQVAVGDPVTGEPICDGI